MITQCGASMTQEQQLVRCLIVWAIAVIVAHKAGLL